ncbi:MAG: class I adenylate-forming enzyme family protein [Acidimicrobiia bacterium]
MPDWGDKQVDQLRFMAREYAEEVAYRDLTAGTAITFAEWDEQSNRLARGLAAHGVQPGDRVSIYLPSEEVLRWIVVYAAVHKAGAVAVPTNTRLTVPEVETILRHAEVAALVTSESLLAKASEVRERAPFPLLVSGARGSNVMPYDELLDQDNDDFQAPVAQTDLADIMYTSGTTGLPKGVAVRHNNVAMIPNHEPMWTGGGWLHGAPLFTFAGIAFIFNPMKMGLRGLYLTPFDAGKWLEAVERERPMMTMLVPAMVELIVAHPDFERRDLSSLQSVAIGAAPIAPPTLTRMQARLPQASVSNSYGITEAGPAYIVMPKEELTKRIGSVGKPIPPMEIKIVDDDGNECAPQVVGELLTRMPGVQREYYKDEQATADTWTPDGWLRTGDLAKLDADGFLYIAGRKKDMIIRGGHNIYATDVEAVIMDHPAIREAAVVGVPHKTLGEDVAAFVVLKPQEVLTAEDLKAFCAARLADYKCPRQVHFVDELPRNATQKVMKHLLSVPPSP